VSRDGTAEVPLSDEVLDVGDRQLSLLFAQLGWTLGQIAGVERIRVTVDGTPLDLPGARADVRVDQASEFDPAVAWASTALFGIRDRRVVSVVGSRENRLSGPFGTVPTDLRSLAVDLPAQHVAAVTGDGTRVVTGDTERSPDQPAVGGRTVYVGGRDVLRPAYDLYGQTWLVDRTASGARVVVVRNGSTRVVDAPGLSGRDVARFVLSRDGTRLVAQVRTDGRDGLVVSRVRRDARGRVRSVTPAVPLPLSGVGSPRLRDLAWRTPGSLAVLAGPSAGTSQVLVVRIDGSSTPDDLTGDAEVFRDQAVQVLTAPNVGAPLYIRTAGGQLFALAGTGRWTGTSVRPGLGAPTFVG
jgi:hypothetical protein